MVKCIRLTYWLRMSAYYVAVIPYLHVSTIYRSFIRIHVASKSLNSAVTLEIFSGHICHMTFSRRYDDTVTYAFEYSQCWIYIQYSHMLRVELRYGAATMFNVRCQRLRRLTTEALKLYTLCARIRVVGVKTENQ